MDGAGLVFLLAPLVHRDAPELAELLKRRLKLALVVGGARHDDGVLSVPIPVIREARVRLRMNRVLDLCVPPVFAAVGRDFDPGDLAAAGPGDTRDLVVAAAAHL